MHMASLELSSSSLWWESIVALVMSSHSRAMFSYPCNWSTSSGSPAGSALGEVWSCGRGKVLATSGIFGMVSGDGEWLMWVILGISSGVTACGDICEGFGILTRIAGSSSFGLEEFSVTSLGHGAPKAPGGGSLFGLLDWTLPRSNSRGGVSHVGSSMVAAFQSGSSSKVNCMALSSSFSPSGYTTQLSCYSNFHTCNWWSQPQAFVLGTLCHSADMSLTGQRHMVHGVVHLHKGIQPVWAIICHQ